MNHFYSSLKLSTGLFIFFLHLFIGQDSFAQCTGGSVAGSITPTTSYQTQSVPAGTWYYTFVVPGTCMPTYDFSFCSADGGSAGYDTQITILDNSGVAVSGGYNDDFCGTQSHVTWTPTSGGTYRVLINNYYCGATSTSSTLAYKYTAAANMTYSSATTAQASTATVYKCDVDQAILQIQVVTATGSCNALSFTQLKLVMAGTNPTVDVSKIHIYYTGTSSTFAATNAFDGTGTTPATGTITINGSQTLSQGTNYFWVAYDMNTSATTGNTVDALVPASAATALTVGGVARTVTANNPAGSRTIAACPVTPGSVSSGLTLWLKPNAGVSTSGVNVTGWTDQSTAVTSVTVTGSPDYTNPGYNFNPYINFTQSSGNGGDYLRIPTTTYLQSFFWVAKLNNLSRKSTHLATYDNVTTSQPCALCPIHGGENGGAVAQYNEATYGSGNFQSAGVWRKNGAAATYNTAHSGNYDIVTALGGSAVPTNVLMGGQVDLVSISFDGRTRDWIGPVGEIIAYSGALSTAQANKIESYLAVKYGITLGGNGATTLAYTSPTGTTIWNSNTGYHYDVMGIGKDLLTEALDQPKSRSINSPLDLVTFANSNFSSPTSLTNNGDYLISGHNNGSLAVPVMLTFTHNGPATVLEEQLSRVWRTQKTGTPSGNLIMGFDMNLVNGPTGYGTNANADIRLLVDDDANFTNGSGGEHTYSPTSGYTATGGTIYFTVPYSDIQSGTGYYTLASVNAMTANLPVELTNFEAKCLNKKVTVSWSTATETNNKNFTVERGSNPSDMTSLAVINGSGTSLMAHQYSYIDQEPLNVNYYRLKQTDLNGDFKYYNIVEAICKEGDKKTGVYNVYPNPTSGNLNFEVVCEEGTGVTVTLYDALGRCVLEEKKIQTGEQMMGINLADISKGVYTLRIVIGDNESCTTTKIIKN